METDENKAKNKNGKKKKKSPLICFTVSYFFMSHVFISECLGPESLSGEYTVHLNDWRSSLKDFTKVLFQNSHVIFHTGVCVCIVFSF